MPGADEQIELAALNLRRIKAAKSCFIEKHENENTKFNFEDKSIT